MGVEAAEDFPTLPPVKTKAVTSDNNAADGYRYVEQPLSPASKVFLHPNFYTVIACALEFQDKMDVDVLREHLAKTFIRHPRFRSKVVRHGILWLQDRTGDSTIAHPHIGAGNIQTIPYSPQHVRHTCMRFASLPRINNMELSPRQV